MNKFTNSNDSDGKAIFPLPAMSSANPIEIYTVEQPQDFDPDDLFNRQAQTPGHKQSAIDARYMLIGAGGINSPIALALMRMGSTYVTILDDDIVELSNLARQFFYTQDIGKSKGLSLAKNISCHATANATVTGIGLRFEDAVERFPLPCDLIIVGVDNNATRLNAARYARKRGIPAVFVAHSLDGMRVNVFLQGPWSHDPCWHCAQPNLDPERAAPCAAAIMTSCYLGASFAIFLGHRALMGWPRDIEPYNWREADLLGIAPDRTGVIRQRRDCPTCGTLS